MIARFSKSKIYGPPLRSVKMIGRETLVLARVFARLATAKSLGISLTDESSGTKRFLTRSHPVVLHRLACRYSPPPHYN